MKEKPCFVCGKPYTSDSDHTFQYYHSPVIANSSNNTIFAHTLNGANVLNIPLNPLTGPTTSITTIGSNSSISFNGIGSESVVETMIQMSKNGLCNNCAEEIRNHLMNVEKELLYKEAMNQVKKDRIKKRGFIYGWEEKRKKRNNTEDNTSDSD